PNAPTDTIESVTWGHEWRLGYAKHPPLSAWVSEAAVTLSHKQLWSIYLISQLAVVSAFLAVWKLGKELLLSEWQAVLAAMLLEGCYYYSYTSYELNPNVLELGIWPWLCFLFWRAVTRGGWRWWLALGAVGAVSMYAKYYSAFLLGPLFLLLLVTPEGRQQWKKPALYAAIIVMLALLYPHIQWVVNHHFTTLQYAAGRSHENFNLWRYLRSPVHFLLAQLLAVLGGIIMAVYAFRPKRSGFRLPGFRSPPDFREWFPWAITFGPLALTLLVALTGRNLDSMWGTPLWGTLGLVFMLNARPAVDNETIRRFVKIWSVMFLLALTVFGVQTVAKPGSSQFPGKDIAAALTSRWHDRFHRKLTIVGGSLWFAGNVGFYSDDRPHMFVDLDTNKSEWLTADDLRREGGIIVWQVDGSGFLPAWRRQFPYAEIQPELDFPWAFRKDKPPFRLGWAIVPPAMQ
ncbi:MAG: glycosyltransferase family 39 protein, partial [Pseudomonadota bacterium]|nr:glycosyltransferase family 39 protein [Pseudomonadota bacterium]